MVTENTATLERVATLSTQFFLYWLNAVYTSARWSFILLYLTLLVTCDAAFSAGISTAKNDITYSYDLHRETTLVNSSGVAKAIIVVPDDGRYDSLAQALQSDIQEKSGSSLPIVTDNDRTPEDLLTTHSVIALGNMASSRFIRRLYEQWKTLLDLRFPGRGGFVVRSIHNPYGSGNNIILLGGSDDDGTGIAVHHFIDTLRPSSPLSIGRQMTIELGTEMTPPAPMDTIYTWDDSWRVDQKGKTFGYKPGTNFGWNPISARAVLYYMTGRQTYLDDFLSLAIPHVGTGRKLETFTLEEPSNNADLKHPLRKMHHYHSHIFALIWDLIDEDPGITDRQRQIINSDLAAHARLMEGHFKQIRKITDKTGLGRHGLYYALSLYAESRFFSKITAEPRWIRNIEEIQKKMEWWYRYPTWVANDTLQWINTFIEPVLTYFLLSGHQRFVESGGAQSLVGILDSIWRGYPNEVSNWFQPISLMHKAAYMLEDGKYIWLARQPSYNFDVFRIGQSWWPSGSLSTLPPTGDALSIIPVASTIVTALNSPVPPAKAFQFLSFRDGYSSDDYFLLLDGINQGGRNPHHISAITQLRHRGKPLLMGYRNQVYVQRNGISGNHVPRVSALDTAVQFKNNFYLSLSVPDGEFSSWRRDIIRVDDVYTFVADVISPKYEGGYEITRLWQTIIDSVQHDTRPKDTRPSISGGASIATDKDVTTLINGTEITQSIQVQLLRDAEFSLISAVHPGAPSGPGSNNITLDAISNNAALIAGKTGNALISTGPFRTKSIEVDARFLYVSTDQILAIDATLLRLGDFRISLDHPISFNLQTRNGDLLSQSEGSANLRIFRSDATGAETKVHYAITSGTNTFSDAPSIQPTYLAHLLRDLETLNLPLISHTGSSEPEQPLNSELLAILQGPIDHLALQSRDRATDEHLWAVSGEPTPALHILDTTAGTTITRQPLTARVRAFSLVPALQQQYGIAAVLGGDDNVLRTYSSNGIPVWKRESKLSPALKRGDSYHAPWFTDPASVTGIWSILVDDVDNTGTSSIVVGRPSTVEYWKLDGNLIERIPLQDAPSMGTVSQISLLPDLNEPKLLFGRFYCGFDAVSIFAKSRQPLTLSGITRPFLELANRESPLGSTDMTAWMQRGIRTLDVDDLDNDGHPEVTISRSGHWNDIRVFSRDGQHCNWMKSFGPASPSTTQMKNNDYFIRDVLIANLNSNASSEVAVALANGRIMVFDHLGNTIWKRRFPSAVTHLVAVNNRFAAGFSNGDIRLIDVSQDRIYTTHLQAPVTSLTSCTECTHIFAGTKEGTIFRLDTPTE